MTARVAPSDLVPDDDGESRLRRFVRSVFGWSGAPVEADLTAVGLNDEEIEELRMVSTFDDRDLRRLCARFLVLDRDRTRSVHVDDVLSMGEFRHCPFRSRLRFVFASSLRSWQLSYREFVDVLAVFGPDASRDQKLKFLFRVYDFDDDGELSRADLTAAIATVVDEICDDDVVGKIVDKIFQECDPEGHGRLTLRQFREALAESDVDLRVRLTL